MGASDCSLGAPSPRPGAAGPDGLKGSPWRVAPPRQPGAQAVNPFPCPATPSGGLGEVAVPGTPIKASLGGLAQLSFGVDAVPGRDLHGAVSLRATEDHFAQRGVVACRRLME